MRLARTCSGTFVMSTSLRKMRPAVGFRLPAIRSKSVVFPAPFEPMTVMKSPPATFRLTSLTARFSSGVPWLKVMLTFSSLIMEPPFRPERRPDAHGDEAEDDEDDLDDFQNPPG